MKHRCSVCRRYAIAGEPHNCIPPQPVELSGPIVVLEPRVRSEKVA